MQSLGGKFIMILTDSLSIFYKINCKTNCYVKKVMVVWYWMSLHYGDLVLRCGGDSSIIPLAYI